MKIIEYVRLTIVGRGGNWSSYSLPLVKWSMFMNMVEGLLLKNCMCPSATLSVTQPSLVCVWLLN